MRTRFAVFIATTLFTSFTVLSEEHSSYRTDQQLSELIRQDCGSCHGMTLKGGLGSPLLPESLKNKPDEYLFTVIQQGIPSKAMPAWQDILNKSQTTRIIKLLRSGKVIKDNAKIQ